MPCMVIMPPPMGFVCPWAAAQPVCFAPGGAPQALAVPAAAPPPLLAPTEAAGVPDEELERELEALMADDALACAGNSGADGGGAEGGGGED